MSGNSPTIGALWQKLEARELKEAKLPPGSKLNSNGAGGSLWLELNGDAEELFMVQHFAGHFKIQPNHEALLKIGIDPALALRMAGDVVTAFNGS